MLLSESELNMYNTYSILDEAVLLDESESIVKLPAIPVVENSRLGCGMVSINDLCNLVEDYDCSFEDAFCSIAEENEIDTDSLAVVVEDYNLIEMPELVDIVPNIVVKPISEDNIVYQFVDACINEYYETGDEDWLYNILDEAESVLRGGNSTDYEIGKIIPSGEDQPSAALQRARERGREAQAYDQAVSQAKNLAGQLKSSQQQVAQLTSKNQQLTADAEHSARKAMGAQDARQAEGCRRG